MKRRNIVFLANLVVITANAQSGDFQLENLQQHTYIKTNANSDLSGNGIKRWLIGKNYRKEWTDSIRVPILDFKNDFGGFKPEKEGGGKQTRTLHLKDGNGRDWVLRSVQKFPEKVIAPEMKGTVAESLVSDGISASYPYSVLSVGTLAKASGVPYLPNTVVYIPDDTALGEFRSKYGNTLALLELRSTENKEAKTFDTEEIIPELYNDNKKLIDQKAVLKARLLDNFIMDLDRHEGQWIWLQKDSAGKNYYYPIPKDRDQSFFKATGLLPRKLSRKSTLGQLQGLSAKPKNILTFNYAARNFDRVFLSELNENTWSNEIDAFLSSMSDDVIADALNKQPEEIQKYKATKIAEILKEKRATFKDDMMRYYRFLSSTVSVVGSNKPEVFEIVKKSDGSVAITVKDAKDSTITYQRLLDAGTTHEIRIYGLEGEDHFLITGENSAIKIRLIGGPGEDVFINNSADKKVIVYDVSFEENLVQGKFKNKISKDPLVNEYQRINPIYNSSSIGPTAEFSGEGGLFLGLKFTGTTTGFRKEPYASKHSFYVTKALRSGAWHLHYDADFLKVGRKTDLLFRSDAKLPTVRTHFFGYGNSTVFDKANGIEYYKVEYPFVEAAFLVRHSLASWLKLQYGPAFQYFNISEEKNNEYYLATLTPHQIESSSYGAKSYAGAEARIIIDTKNNQLVPTRGIGINMYTRPMAGIGGESEKLNQSGGDFSFYTDFLFKKHIIIASSFGAHHTFGDFEIPQAQYLGVRQNLRGYRYQRFAGRSSAYNNTELRINFGDVNFYLFKGPFGILGFRDVGRVWADGENSNTWHKGYGGGLWMAPFNKIVLMGLLAFSEEEKAFPMAKIGFQF
jgi:hypothetical protein